MLARYHAGTTGARQRVGNEAIDEAHAILRNTIEVGSLNMRLIVARHHLRRMIVRHDIQDIGPLLSISNGGKKGKKRDPPHPPSRGSEYSCKMCFRCFHGCSLNISLPFTVYSLQLFRDFGISIFRYLDAAVNSIMNYEL